MEAEWNRGSERAKMVEDENNNRLESFIETKRLKPLSNLSLNDAIWLQLYYFGALMVVWWHVGVGNFQTENLCEGT